MKILTVNKDGVHKYMLECSSFSCKYSIDGVTTVINQKGQYMYDRKCKICGSILN